MVNFISGLHHQGVFRVSGSQVEINHFKENFERGDDPLVEITDASDVNENNPNLAGNPIQLSLDFSYVDGQTKAPAIQTIPTGESPATRIGKPR